MNSWAVSIRFNLPQSVLERGQFTVYLLLGKRWNPSIKIKMGSFFNFQFNYGSVIWMFHNRYINNNTLHGY